MVHFADRFSRTAAFPSRSKTGRIRSDANVVFHTIGYEEASVPDFLARLVAHKITVIVDVRDLPLSRRRGFSKNQLRDHLRAAGIRYEHVRALGAPKPLRHRLRQGGAWGEYVVGYRQVLTANQKAVVGLRELATNERICLLCYERDPEQCHRSLVAAEMQGGARGTQFHVDHIRY